MSRSIATTFNQGMCLGAGMVLTYQRRRVSKPGPLYYWSIPGQPYGTMICCGLRIAIFSQSRLYREASSGSGRGDRAATRELRSLLTASPPRPVAWEMETSGWVQFENPYGKKERMRRNLQISARQLEKVDLSPVNRQSHAGRMLAGARCFCERPLTLLQTAQGAVCMGASVWCACTL